MKKTLSLILALFLCFALSYSTFADVWIPPIDDESYCAGLEELAYSKGGAEVLNRFASEYLHAGLKTFDESTADGVIAAAVVRMIMQHPEQYNRVLRDPTGVTGISEEAFASCAEARFGRTLRAGDFYSCENGYFLVSESTPLTVETPSDTSYAKSSDFSSYADHAAHPRNLFAYANSAYYLGDGNYQMYFLTYETTSDPETCYAINDPETAENARRVGYCYMMLKYSGDVEATQFDPSDFTLLGFYTDTLTEEETERLNQRETQTVTEPESPPTFAMAVDDAPTDEAPQDAGFWTTGTILLTVGIAVLAVGAAIAVLLIKKIKR
ncbi:MAG: hypothetical protein IJG45_06525 [Oscillospiraceae bacterium]|nr:hypothetical protein [Oscillospiraceae bacterium]